MRYFEDAKQLWKTFVPKSGQASTVQGELIRAVEKLRWEAQNNGNGNWDDEAGSVDQGFIRFCDFLEKTLAITPSFDVAALQEIRADVARLRDFEHPYLAYLEDHLFDRLSDRIVEFRRYLGKLATHAPDPDQYR